METYNRRAFLKRSAISTAVYVAGQSLIPSLSTEAAFHPVPERRSQTVMPPGQVPEQQRVEFIGNKQVSTHPFFAQAKHHPEVIAHRGGDLERPGETLFAFEHAVQSGADILEMDVYRTWDGDLVLMHNPTVNETTNGKGFVNFLTLKKLKTLNAGYDWSDDGGQNHRYRELNLPVATLREVFEAFPNARMNIEMKTAFFSPVEKLCELIQEKKMTDKVLVASFNDIYMKDFRRRCPEVATSASFFEILSYFRKNQPLKAQAIQLTPDFQLKIERKLGRPKHQVLTKEFVERAQQEFHLQVHAWTINEPEEMKRVIAMGVDGIITDAPSQLLKILGRSQSA